MGEAQMVDAENEARMGLVQRVGTGWHLRIRSRRRRRFRRGVAQRRSYCEGEQERDECWIYSVGGTWCCCGQRTGRLDDIVFCCGHFPSPFRMQFAQLRQQAWL